MSGQKEKKQQEKKLKKSEEIEGKKTVKKYIYIIFQEGNIHEFNYNIFFSTEFSQLQSLKKMQIISSKNG
jgi:hypothetical protein